MKQLLAQMDKNQFENKMKLERLTMERDIISEEKQYLERERNEMKQRLKETIEENSKCKENEISQKCRIEAAEEALEKATFLHYEAERGRRFLEHEKEETEKQCALWMEKYNTLADLLHSQEEEKLKRQNKACQVELKTYFLCISESSEQRSVLNNEDGTPQRFAEGEQVCFSFPAGWQTVAAENEEKAKNTNRFLYKIIAPGSNSGQAQTFGLCPVELQENMPTRRGKKIVEYFWFPVDNE
ncbi:uncharacterized protein LOC143828929 [Paroedura picta]|uniref:uncharacterized protein LOC143828929 n=1 Tax=Paroedura picta TaxID=143630 RepID=UPI0040573ABA